MYGAEIDQSKVGMRLRVQLNNYLQLVDEDKECIYLVALRRQERSYYRDTTKQGSSYLRQRELAKRAGSSSGKRIEWKREREAAARETMVIWRKITSSTARHDMAWHGMAWALRGRKSNRFRTYLPTYVHHEGVLIVHSELLQFSNPTKAWNARCRLQIRSGSGSGSGRKRER